MIKKILFLAILIACSLFFLGCEKKSNNDISDISSQKNLTALPKGIIAEKIEVVHFHATQQCWSCITLGEYTKKTIEERFAEKQKNGTIVFEEINGDLPENREMVIKYQASGSSLFINAITGGKDNIEEEITAWQFVSNKNKFMDYLENKLKGLLGK